MREAAGLDLAGQPDRIRVFVSSTIGECAKQRREALAAIQSLDLGSFVFEREGARTYGPRTLYLAKLAACHLAVGIYRSSYGWVDTANGQTISGLEDEYREIERLGLDLLAYVEKDAKRDARLTGFVDEILASRTVHMFADSEDLEPRIRSDILTVLSQSYSKQRAEAGRRATAPGLTLDAIFRQVPYRVRRAALHDRLANSLAAHRIVWVTGGAGSGKTVLVAEHAERRDLPYVNARGLEPRELLAKAADALRQTSSGESSAPRTYDEARALLREAWQAGARWPLVIDDPADADALWVELQALLRISATGTVVVATRSPPAGHSGGEVEVVGFDAGEVAQLERIVSTDSQRNLQSLTASAMPVLPLDARAALDPTRPAGDGAAEPSVAMRYRGLDGAARDLVGYIAMSPVALTLEDLAALQGEIGPGEVQDQAGRASHMLVEDAVGYALLHGTWAAEIAEEISTSAQYAASLRERLVSRLVDERLFFAGFKLLRDHEPDRAALLARRSLRAVVFTGSIGNLLEALTFLVEHDRATDDKGSLATDLVFLVQMSSHVHGQSYCQPLLEEAVATAATLDDPDLLRVIEDFAASYRLQTTASTEAFAEVRAARERYEEEGDLLNAGRLLIDEAVGFMGVSDGPAAEPLLRTAIGYFEELGDTYGRDIAARNLATVLMRDAAGAEEAKALVASLESDSREGSRHRAWECNVLNRQLRDEGRYEEAEAMAREAIDLADQLGDRYLRAINLIALGNTFRDRKDSAAALPFYEEAGRESGLLSRPDIEGRASRLAAASHNELAELSPDALDHAGKAEHFARYAIAVLQNSAASYDLADAWDELCRALDTLSRREESLDARTQSIALFAQAGEDVIAGQMRRSLARELRDDSLAEAAEWILASFALEPKSELATSLWAEAVSATLLRAEPAAVPSVLSMLTRKLSKALPRSIHDDALDALLRALRHQVRRAPAGHWPMLLLTILAWFRSEALSVHQLLRYAALCLEDEPVLRMRPANDGDLHLAIEIGEQREHLFTFHAGYDDRDEVYLALCLACFVAAFGETISARFIAPLASGPQAFEIVAMSMDSCPADLAETMAKYLEELPVAMIGFERVPGEHPTIGATARQGLLSAMTTSTEHADTFEVVLATLLRAIVEYCFEASFDDFLEETKALVGRMLF